MTLTPEQLEDVKRRKAAGENLTVMAEEFGYSNRRTFGTYLNRQGVRFSHSPRWERSLYLPNDPVTLAYIAGLFDGEGSIVNARRDNLIQLKVAMTDEAVITWLASFGGTFETRAGATERHLRVWCWRASRQLDVLHALDALIPYLRVKRAKAEQALSDMQAKFSEVSVEPSKRTMRWALYYDACVRCGTAQTAHEGHGLCQNCFAADRRAAKRAHD